MKKIISLIIFSASISGILDAQTNTFPSTGSAGIGTTSPNSSSLLDITSTTKGVLFPRMTKTQRDAIASAATGLMIYQTNSTPGFYYFNGSTWQAVSPKGVNKTLSNLTAPTAINTDLLPGTNNFVSLGGNTSGWKDFYLNGKIYFGGAPAISTTGTYNFFAGSYSGYAISSGSDNVALGYYSLGSNTSGSFNTATGASSMFFNTTGSGNTAGGFGSLYSNTTGYSNTAYGIESMLSNTSGTNNSGIGDSALYYNVSGSWNTAVGAGSMTYNNTGSYNTIAGWNSLYLNTTGGSNTASGAFAMHYNTSGFDNVALGTYALFYNQIGFGNSAVGYASGPGAGIYTNTTSLGYMATATASDQVRLGNSFVTSIGGYANWTNVSDGRVKKNIKQNVPGLAFINKLQPVTYNLDLTAADNIIQKPELKDKDGKIIQPSSEQLTARKQKEQILYTGFVAQDVEKVAKSLNYDFSGVDIPKNDKDLYGLRYSDFVVPLVKAVQELSKTNDEKDSAINTLNDKVDKLQSQLNTLMRKLNGSNSITQSAVNDVSIANTNARLEQNVPNPANGNTTIKYYVPSTSSKASIMITDMNGHILKSVVLSNKGAGEIIVYSASFAPGNYFYSLIVDGNKIDSKQMILAK